ncbi:hypothetical protein B0H15DRAFT_199247 [Mycena belliarum]|uniref:Uncharacterized protein n=1 Tax=Mycena belliarum TaxID=1033014 RepID=A0AAD6UNZ6_9AGAR|nr:hypothetical protein B0H15DRAFT_199247 [Mycena belliae]
MSPLLRRDGPATYAYLAADLPSPSPSFATSSMNDSSTTVTLEAYTIVACLSLLLFVLWAVAIFLFAPSLHKTLMKYRAKQSFGKKIKTRIQGLGFGYDGLSQAAFEGLMQKEQEDGRRSYMRWSPYPPSLGVITPLPPITILEARSEHDVLEAQVHAGSDQLRSMSQETTSGKVQKATTPSFKP